MLVEKMKKRTNIAFPRLEDNVPVIRCKNQAYVGKTVQELAKEAGICSEEMVLNILLEDMDTYIRPILAGERPRDLEGPFDYVYKYWTYDGATIGTDNCAYNYDYEGLSADLPKFRFTTTAYCGYIIYLQESEKAGIPFETTIRKVIGNPAQALRMKDRGYLKVGQQADIVVLDMEHLATNEDFFDPRQQPSGLDYVIVNGQIAVDHGVHTHVRSGVILDNRDR